MEFSSLLPSIPKLRTDFRYGASLRGHAVEGEDFASDWWHWEQRPGRIADGTTSAEGAGHLSRFREDATLANTLGLNTVLISLSWARIIPERGEVDSSALSHYRERLSAFQKHGVEPFVVLWDTAVPQWFAARGYWRARGACEDFSVYAGVVFEALKGHCTHWVPLANPAEWLGQAYGGLWPGGEGGWRGALRTIRNLARSHVDAVRRLRDIQPDTRAGLWLSVAKDVPEDPHSPWDLRAARGFGGTSAADLTRALDDAQSHDFLIAANCETRPIRFSPSRPATGFARHVVAPSAARGAGLADLLMNRMTKPTPLYLAFDGAAAHDDASRNAALLDDLHAAALAEASGLDVRGCFFGPLLDGFEWTEGYADRRGLVHVSRETMARTPNPSAFLLRDIARAGGITEGVVARHAPKWKPDLEER